MQNFICKKLLQHSILYLFTCPGCNVNKSTSLTEETAEAISKVHASVSVQNALSIHISTAIWINTMITLRHLNRVCRHYRAVYNEHHTS